MKKATIRLMETPYPNGGSVKAGICELTEWFEASAEDAEGNAYRVIWKMVDIHNEEDECDWDQPWAILDDKYNDVADQVIIHD